MLSKKKFTILKTNLLIYKMRLKSKWMCYIQVITLGLRKRKIQLKKKIQVSKNIILCGKITNIPFFVYS